MTGSLGQDTGSRQAADRQPGKGVIRSAVNKLVLTWNRAASFLLSPFSDSGRDKQSICKLLFPLLEACDKSTIAVNNSGQWFQGLQTTSEVLLVWLCSCMQKPGCSASSPRSLSLTLNLTGWTIRTFLLSWAGGTHLAAWMALPRVGLNGWTVEGGSAAAAGGGKGGVRESRESDFLFWSCGLRRRWVERTAARWH